MDEMISDSQRPNDKTVLDQPTGVTTEKAVLEASELAVPEHRKASSSDEGARESRSDVSGPPRGTIARRRCAGG